MTARAWLVAFGLLYAALGVAWVWTHHRHARALDRLSDAYREHARSTDAYVEQMKASVRDGKQYIAALSELTIRGQR